MCSDRLLHRTFINGIARSQDCPARDPVCFMPSKATNNTHYFCEELFDFDSGPQLEQAHGASQPRPQTNEWPRSHLVGCRYRHDCEKMQRLARQRSRIYTFSRLSLYLCPLNKLHLQIEDMCYVRGETWIYLVQVRITLQGKGGQNVSCTISTLAVRAII